MARRHRARGARGEPPPPRAFSRHEPLFGLCRLPRGGADGLSLAPPIGDATYQSLRTGIAVADASRTIVARSRLHDNFVGKAVPERPSELAWLDADWNVTERVPLSGVKCHDIVADERGCIWHSASMRGEIVSSDGRRASISDDLMTRGVAFSGNLVAVGLSIFSDRHLREGQRGSLAILDRELAVQEILDLPGSPTDIAAIAD